MQRFVLIYFCLAIAFSAVAVTINEFTVIPGNSRITIRWESSSESGLQSYRLERSVDGTPFTELAFVTPRGINQTYQFIDTEIYSLDSSPRIFAYRIKFQMRDGTFTYSATKETTMHLSSIRRTWGSIKAMFR